MSDARTPLELQWHSGAGAPERAVTRAYRQLGGLARVASRAWGERLSWLYRWFMPPSRLASADVPTFAAGHATRLSLHEQFARVEAVVATGTSHVEAIATLHERAQRQIDVAELAFNRLFDEVIHMVPQLADRRLGKLKALLRDNKTDDARVSSAA